MKILSKKDKLPETITVEFSREEFIQLAAVCGRASGGKFGNIFGDLYQFVFDFSTEERQALYDETDSYSGEIIKRTDVSELNT